MIEKKDIVIVVPRYKEQMSKDEKLSYHRLRQVLKDYDMFFVSPSSMEDYYSRTGGNVVCFDDDWFVSQHTYSNLLISKDFYHKFSKYEYMLIYQLDAIVFRDELLDWCNRGYDYIGAPMPFFSSYELYQINSDKTGYVGNGGFSLRNIQSTVRILDSLDEMYAFFGRDYVPEDQIYAFFGLDSRYNYKVPTVDEAEKFAIEFDVNHSYDRICASNLPFGVHAWNKPSYRGVWKAYIESLSDNYHVETEPFDYKRDYFDNWIKKSYEQFLLRTVESEKLIHAVRGVVGKRAVVIWGAGIRGICCYKLLQKAGVQVLYFIDLKKKGMIDEISIVSPNEYLEDLKDNYVIITPKGYENDVANRLHSIGMMPNSFIYYDDWVSELIKSYSGKTSWELYCE